MTRSIPYRILYYLYLLWLGYWAFNQDKVSGWLTNSLERARIPYLPFWTAVMIAFLIPAWIRVKKWKQADVFSKYTFVLVILSLFMIIAYQVLLALQ